MWIQWGKHPRFVRKARRLLTMICANSVPNFVTTDHVERMRDLHRSVVSLSSSSEYIVERHSHRCAPTLCFFLQRQDDTEK